MEVRNKQHGKVKVIMIVVIVFLIGVLASILFYKFIHRNDRYKPTINPNPKHFITISGKIDPRLEGEFQVIYQTTNKQCQEVINRFEGVYVPREKDYLYKIYPISHNNYKLQVPVDSIKIGGYCDWKLTGIYYTAYLKKNLKLSSSHWLFLFSKNRSSPIKYAANIRCVVGVDSVFLCDRNKSNYFTSIPNNTKNVEINFLYPSSGGNHEIN